MEFALTCTTHGKERVSSPIELECWGSLDWHNSDSLSDFDTPPAPARLKELVSSSEEISRKSDFEILRQLALENFATRVESGLKILWKVLRNSSEERVNNPNRAASVLVAEMKEQFQCLEESLAPGGASRY